MYAPVPQILIRVDRIRLPFTPYVRSSVGHIQLIAVIPVRALHGMVALTMQLIIVLIALSSRHTCPRNLGRLCPTSPSSRLGWRVRRWLAGTGRSCCWCQPRL
jgi:hypothetical protein